MRVPATIALAAACTAISSPVAAQDYYQDVRPVLVERCMGCHTDDGVAWSMDDPEGTFDRHREIAGAITTRQMPPWLAERGHQEYLGDLSLDEGVVGMVASWREADYPKGTAVPDRATSAARHAFEPDVSLDLMPGTSYLPDQSMADEYRCFVVDWPQDTRGYVTGFRTVPGNLGVAHHTVVHAVAPEMVDRFKEIEAEEEGGGYQCFGGALPSSLDRQAYEARYPDGLRELDRSTFWLAHWAPGMDGHEFADGTGIMLQPGAGLVVQMHYYTEDAPGEADEGSRIEFQFAETVDRPAFHLSQTNNAWLGAERNGSMVIPAGEMATYETSEDLGDLLGYVAFVTEVDRDRIEGLELYSANLHMHAFGHSGEISLIDPDGQHETLLSVPKWDLHWQRDFAFAEPKIIPRDQLEGTSIRVQCTYENPTDETVYGGYGSFDEMCFNFSYIAVQVDDRPVGAGSGR